jgi:hypothetical protein
MRGRREPKFFAAQIRQQMAAHSAPKTTLLYDRRSDQVSLDDVEQIAI